MPQDAQTYQTVRTLKGHHATQKEVSALAIHVETESEIVWSGSADGSIVAYGQAEPTQGPSTSGTDTAAHQRNRSSGASLSSDE